MGSKVLKLNERKVRFRWRIQPFLLSISVLAVLLGFIVVLIVGLEDFYLGIFVSAPIIIVALTVRNYCFARQTSHDELDEPATYVSLIKWMIPILFAYIAAVDLFPVSWVARWDIRIRFTLVILSILLGLLIITLNLYYPWWSQRRNLGENASPNMKELYDKFNKWFDELDVSFGDASRLDPVISASRHGSSADLSRLENRLIRMNNTMEFIAFSNYLSMVSGKKEKAEMVNHLLKWISLLISIIAPLLSVAADFFSG